MKDSEFKVADHPVGNLIVATRGTEVSKGYKPDVTVSDRHGELRFILESEQKTDRKAFLGDLIKAEVHAEGQQAHPALVIVIKPSSNTTTKQIADHLRPYKQWLEQKKGGALNLSAIHVVSDADYREAITEEVQLGSEAFTRRGHVV